jgi:hypothetical protein
MIRGQQARATEKPDVGPFPIAQPPTLAPKSGQKTFTGRHLQLPSRQQNRFKYNNETA